MASSDRGAPRGDNVPAGDRDESIEQQHAASGERPEDESAGRRSHGTHGRGGSEEERVDPAVPAPDAAKGSDRGGSAAWGSERSGGSVIDKRSPER